MDNTLSAIKVRSENEAVKDTYQLLSVEINYQINKIPSATLTYVDATGYVGKPGASRDTAFAPGKSIELVLQQSDSKYKTIFKGLIVKHKIKYNNKGAASLILELRHAALNLTTSRNNSVFTNKSDQEIFKEIGKKYKPELDFSAEVNTKDMHKQMVQAWCSDWDFILSRAESNGWWLICDIEGNSNQLRLIDPNKINSTVSDLDLTSKGTILAADLCIDIENQVDKISAKSWNVNEQDVATGESPATKLLIVEGGILKKLTNSTSYNLYHPGDISEGELTTWALGRKTRNKFSLFGGRIKLSGRLDINIGTRVKLKDIGQYFDGTHVICSVRHLLDKTSGFDTEIGIGIPVEGLIAMRNAEPPSAGAMLPAIKGLYIGVVTGYAVDDKNNQLLVKVKLPFFDQGKDGNEVWGRLTSIYAGAKRGVVFRPEKGDEVVLGFFNEDPRYPVILGSMHSDKNKPPIPFTEANNEKAIIINGENVHILLDDKKKSIVLKTSEGNKMGIDEKGISLEDKNKNSVILDAQGIGCSSKKVITIKASQVKVE